MNNTKQQKVVKLALKKMKDHGIDNQEWKVTINKRLTRVSAYCCPYRKVISLSTNLIKNGTMAQIEHIIMHEIVHALGYYGHNDAYYKKLKDLTGRDKAEEDAFLAGSTEGLYVHKCQKCGLIKAYRIRPIQNSCWAYACPECKSDMIYVQKKEID